MARHSDPSEQLRRLEELVVGFPIAIVNIDARGRVRCCNPAFEALFLYAAAEAHGKNLIRLIGLADARDAANALRELARGRDVHATIHGARKDRRVVEVEFHGIGGGTRPRDDHWGLFHDVSAPEGTLSRVTRTLIAAQEGERLRVSRDLHDDIGQRLAVCQLAMDRMKPAMRGSRAGVVRQLDDLRREAAALSADVRRLSYELYSPALMLLGLDDAIAQLCADTSRHFRMKITCTSRGVPASVSAAVSQCLFRITQDSLFIAADHRGPGRRASVHLHAARAMIHLRLRHLGADASETFATDHEMRFITMRARVAAVNGTLSRTALHRAGTQIDVDVPL